ncbi:MAG: hypothetical protein HPY85_14300 [Anaerolineae bacterium]|nr:hypothetical protein [Anaerolineae bacterium]
MKHTTWRYIVGIFLILVGAGMFVVRLMDLPVRFVNLVFGIVMALGGVLFLLPVFRSRINWWALLPGIPLVLMGVALSVGAFLPTVGDLVGPALLFGLGLAFVITYLLYKQHWWALIPGMILLGIGASVGVSVILPETNGDWVAFFILGSIGLAFLLVYLVDRRNWWALIPGGVMVSVGSLVLTGEVAYLFLGMGATFALVALLAGKDNWWAWIPCGVLATMGIGFLFFSESAGTVGKFFFPALLILFGIIAIVQVLLPKKSS